MRIQTIRSNLLHLKMTAAYSSTVLVCIHYATSSDSRRS